MASARGTRPNHKFPIAVVLAVWLLPAPLAAEEACVKYHKCVLLDQFRCDDITRSGFIHRVCYAEAKRYMIIWLGENRTPYHYCEMGREVKDEFFAAPSMGRYFNDKITGTRNKRGPFDCRDHPIPEL
jgi:hypothetical protein